MNSILKGEIKKAVTKFCGLANNSFLFLFSFFPPLQIKDKRVTCVRTFTCLPFY